MARKDGIVSGAKSARSLPLLGAIGEDTPLQLNVAAALAYPDGSMTTSGLRVWSEGLRADEVIEPSMSGPRAKITPHLDPYGE
jgi:hypothetical protein